MNSKLFDIEISFLLPWTVTRDQNSWHFFLGKDELLKSTWTLEGITPQKNEKKKKKSQKQYNIKHKTKKCLTVSMLYAKSPKKGKWKEERKKITWWYFVLFKIHQINNETSLQVLVDSIIFSIEDLDLPHSVFTVYCLAKLMKTNFVTSHKCLKENWSPKLS